MPSSSSPDLAADRARALALTPVSRETATRLDRFAAELLTWQRRINLIAPSTVGQLWTRHIADSLQLLEFMPSALRWVDLGSGAGFPGLVIACALADRAKAEVHLIESNAKKAAFLREATRVTRAPAIVHAKRIETFANEFGGSADVVTARALAPLTALFAYSARLLKAGAIGLFPKGQDVGVELTEASKYWTFSHELIPSRTDPKGRIVKVRALERHLPAR